MYKLEDYWNRHLRSVLNDFVHNNGIGYAHQNAMHMSNQNIKTCFHNINYRVGFISSFFVVLLIMIDPSLISSTDYGDYINIKKEPPANSQYWIAEFIQEFIDQRVIKLHPELKQYLIDNNKYRMQIK